ncbi:hypothetical protein C486_15019 [Natrinema gari JCM 14663]|uniref:Uncharacterized protein n=1 Tax=Natrinema gari JCM 14663 TaxID=1230459 RepID=L9YUR4_9EURY|nr:hypothetical protein C486_15019 [Natrinema gari JCM 14663]
MESVDVRSGLGRPCNGRRRDTGVSVPLDSRRAWRSNEGRRGRPYPLDLVPETSIFPSVMP